MFGIVGASEEWPLARGVLIAGVPIGSMDDAVSLAWDGAVAVGWLTHLFTLQPQASLTGLRTRALDKLVDHEQTEEHDAGKGTGEGGLRLVINDVLEDLNGGGFDAANVFPLSVAGNGGVLTRIGISFGVVQMAITKNAPQPCR